MNCHTCGKFIDLEFTKEEEERFQGEMEDSGVIMVCVNCYEPEESETEIETLERTHRELSGE